MKEMQELMKKLQSDLPQKAMYDSVVKEIREHEAIKEFFREHSELDTAEFVKHNLSKFNEFVRVNNQISQGKRVMFAPKLILNNNRVDIMYEMTEEARATQRTLKQSRLLDNRMMSLDVKNATLSSIDLATPERQRIVEELRECLRSYDSNDKSAYGLYLTGPFGVGKTYILGAIANSLVSKNYSVTMLHYPTFIADIKRSISDGTMESMLSYVKNVDVLMIDDIGAESNTNWVRDEVLAVLLETRMRENLPTFFTSNYNLKELETHLANTRESVDVLQAKRLMERVRFLAKEVVLEGENRRLRR